MNHEGEESDDLALTGTTVGLSDESLSLTRACVRRELGDFLFITWNNKDEELSPR
ncbi:hypothetical protein YC2023_070882 [Brassica napus]